jgi:intracellular sulfur oxidation DsrE/DsrF family protein
VELVVCGQSLAMFGNKSDDVIPQVKIATSALTAISTYQLKGYAYFKWD